MRKQRIVGGILCIIGCLIVMHTSVNATNYNRKSKGNYLENNGEMRNYNLIIITAEEGALGYGHTSVIIQGKAHKWYYYFWGTKKAVLIEVPSKYMGSLEAFNKWIASGAEEGEAYYKHQYYKNAYTSYVYLKGDYRQTYRVLADLVSKYKVTLEGKKNKKKNYRYKLYTNNCLQTIVRGLGMSQDAQKLLTLSEIRVPNDYQRRLEELYPEALSENLF